MLFYGKKSWKYQQIFFSRKFQTIHFARQYLIWGQNHWVIFFQKLLCQNIAVQCTTAIRVSTADLFVSKIFVETRKSNRIQFLPNTLDILLQGLLKKKYQTNFYWFPRKLSNWIGLICSLEKFCKKCSTVEWTCF